MNVILGSHDKTINGPMLLITHYIVYDLYVSMHRCIGICIYMHVNIYLTVEITLQFEMEEVYAVMNIYLLIRRKHQRLIGRYIDTELYPFFVVVFILGM